MAKDRGALGGLTDLVGGAFEFLTSPSEGEKSKIAGQQIKNDSARLASAINTIKSVALTTTDNEAANAQLNQIFSADTNLPQFTGGGRDFSAILDKARTGTKDEQFTLSPGQKRFSSGGQEVAAVDAKAPKPSLEQEKIEFLNNLPVEEKDEILRGILGGGGGDDFDKQFNRGFKVAEQFKKEPLIKDFSEIQRAVSNMDAAFELFKQDPESFVAIDQALITSFNKLLDPGSVVRESEFARTAKSLGFSSRLIGSIDKLSKGGAGLTGQDREALVTMAKELENRAKDKFDEIVTEFESRADNARVPRTFVLGNIKRFTPTEQQEETEEPDETSDQQLSPELQEKVGTLRSRGVSEEIIQAAIKLETQNANTR